MLSGASQLTGIHTSRDLWLPLHQPPRNRPYMGTVTVAKSVMEEDAYDEERILEEYEEDAELLELCIQHTSDEVRNVLRRHRADEHREIGSCSQPVCFLHDERHRPTRPRKPASKRSAPEQQLIEGRMPSTHARLKARQHVSDWLRMRSSKRKAEISSSVDLSGDVVPGAGKEPRRFAKTGKIGTFEEWRAAQKDEPGEENRRTTVIKPARQGSRIGMPRLTALVRKKTALAQQVQRATMR